MKTNWTAKSNTFLVRTTLLRMHLNKQVVVNSQIMNTLIAEASKESEVLNEYTIKHWIDKNIN